MLVLSRKANETIRIGDNVTITILKSKGNTVRLGIEAPRDVRVMRGEVLARDESKSDLSNAEPVSQTTFLEQGAEPSGEVLIAGDSGTDSEAACTLTVAMGARCGAESFHDASEDTRCADASENRDRCSSRCESERGYEGDCWSVSSMKRRVRKAVASRK